MPETHAAFEAFQNAVYAEGAPSEQTKQLIAVAVAHVTQSPFCGLAIGMSAYQSDCVPWEPLSCFY